MNILNLRGHGLGRRSMHRAVVSRVLRTWIITIALTPVLAWAQDGTTVIFGSPPQDGGTPYGFPLTCANASASAAQLNTGNNPGIQGGIWGWDAPDMQFPQWVMSQPQDPTNPRQWWPGSFFDLEGAGLLVVAKDQRDPDWAAPPTGAQWVSKWGANELMPSSSNPAETTWITAYFGGWYIPTAADAQRMRVVVRYRAEDQLTGVFLNSLHDGRNLLASPITRDTSHTGTLPGQVVLSGLQQGDNMLTFPVSSRRAGPDAQNYLGFTAAFDAYCVEPPAAVPSTSATGMMALMLALGGFGGWAIRSRRRSHAPRG